MESNTHEGVVEESHVLDEVLEGNLVEDIHGEVTFSEVLHENTIFAEPIINIGGFTVTNSLINTWLVVIVFVKILYPGNS